MHKKDIVDRIKLMLGFPVVRIELNDDEIGKLVDIAYDRVKPYISDERWCTVPYARVIPIKEKAEQELQVEIQDVLWVYRTDQAYYSNSERLFDFQILRMDRQSVMKWVLGSYPITQTQLDIDFRYLDGKLYLDSQTTYQGLVTVKVSVSPQFCDLKDERAIQWIQGYSLALTKMSLGRIRSKFKSSNLPVELDGDNILQEGIQEIERYEQKLVDEQFGPFIVVRD